MRSAALIACLTVLALAACAGVTASDTALYDRLDARDVQLAASAMQQALETAPDGATRHWANDASGHRGAITPTQTYLGANGYFCRDYREEVRLGDEVGRFHHSACRDEAERWVWL
jgi:surface antigen